MDRSLEEIISERPRGGGASRGSRRPAPAGRPPRRDEGPRDGVRKYRRDEPPQDRERERERERDRDRGYERERERDRYVDDRSNIDNDWVHDRYEDDRYDNSHRRATYGDDRQAPRGAAAGSGGSKIRVDNLHYDLTENDLRELFERIGPVVSVNVLYDRADRSQGVAYVVYRSREDASQAIHDFDGCNANGQPIRLTLMPTGPAAAPASKGSLFDRIQAPPRSLFDRISGGPERLSDSRRRRNRSESPRRSDRLAPPENDRAAGARGSRSPITRRGTPREGGRRPGQRKEEGAGAAGGGGGRGGRRQRTDDNGHPIVGGRPRKTAEELDAEMEDYWGQKNGGDNAGAAGAGASTTAANGGAAAAGDVDMDEIQ